MVLLRHLGKLLIDHRLHIVTIQHDAATKLCQNVDVTVKPQSFHDHDLGLETNH